MSMWGQPGQQGQGGYAQPPGGPPQGGGYGGPPPQTGAPPLAAPPMAPPQGGGYGLSPGQSMPGSGPSPMAPPQGDGYGPPPEQGPPGGAQLPQPTNQGYNQPPPVANGHVAPMMQPPPVAQSGYGHPPPVLQPGRSTTQPMHLGGPPGGGRPQLMQPPPVAAPQSGSPQQQGGFPQQSPVPQPTQSAAPPQQHGGQQQYGGQPPVGMGQPQMGAPHPTTYGQQPQPGPGMAPTPSMGQQPMGPPGGQPMQPGAGRPRYTRPGMPVAGLPGAAPGMAPPQMAQPAQAPRPRGIDPDAVPSPVAVEAADIDKYSKQTYSTGSKLVPPLPNTPAKILDDGNCSPRIMRSSMYVVPANKDLLGSVGIPLTLVIQPLADPGTGQPVPRVDHGPDGPVRCTRCKAYVNPGMQFSDGGRRYRCNFCDVESQVPERYFSNLDGAGNRHDLLERPELTTGTVDYVATQVYSQRPPQPASYLFVIDVTHNSVKCGLVAAAAQAILSVLDSFPVDVAHGREHSDARIGIITFGGGIQFYNLTAGLGQPQMMVVTDVGEPFVPLKTGLFVPIHESREIIENLLMQLPHMFEHTKAIDSFFGAAIDVAVQAMEGTGGRMIVFSNSFPTIGPGMLKAREDHKMLGTDAEKSLFIPQIPFYSDKAEECVKHGVAVDLFMCQSTYADIATVGLLSHRTGGSLIRNFGFQSHLHSEKLIDDLRRIVTRAHGFDALMRVRTSLGLRPVEFYGAFTMSNTRDIEFAGIDEEKSVVLECRYDDKLSEQNGAAFQAALLYTTATGERLIRVHTLVLGVGSQIADVFRATDMPVIINALARHALREARMTGLRDLRDQLRKRCIRILAAYRKHCAGPNSPAGQLILPDCLKLLPLYTGCLGKLDAMRGGGTVNADDRMTAIFQIMSLPVDKFLVLLYPQLYQIDDMVPEETGIPDQIRPSYARLKPHAAYLLENGREIVVWFGSKVSPSVIQKLVGAPAFQSIDTKLVKLPQTQDPLNIRLNRLVAYIRAKRHVYMPLLISKQKDPTEGTLAMRLVEDKMNEALSYVDFLCAIHRDIQNMLT